MRKDTPEMKKEESDTRAIICHILAFFCESPSTLSNAAIPDFFLSLENPVRFVPSAGKNVLAIITP